MHDCYPVYVAVSIIIAFVIFIVYSPYRKHRHLIENKMHQLGMCRADASACSLFFEFRNISRHSVERKFNQVVKHVGERFA